MKKIYFIADKNNVAISSPTFDKDSLIPLMGKDDELIEINENDKDYKKLLSFI